MLLRKRPIFGDDSGFALVISVVFALTLSLLAGYFFFSQSQAQVPSFSEHSVPAPTTRDWRGSLPSDRL